jgi:hypothetical protein
MTTKRLSLREAEDLARPAMKAALTDFVLSDSLRRALGLEIQIEADSYRFILAVAGTRPEDSVVIADAVVNRTDHDVCARVYSEQIPAAEARAIGAVEPPRQL